MLIRRPDTGIQAACIGIERLAIMNTTKLQRDLVKVVADHAMRRIFLDSDQRELLQLLASLAEPDVLVERNLHVVAVVADRLGEFLAACVLAFFDVQGEQGVADSVEAALDGCAGFAVLGTTDSSFRP